MTLIQSGPRKEVFMNKEMELIVQRMDDEIVGNLSNLDEA
jgi:hypothetical protein